MGARGYPGSRVITGKTEEHSWRNLVSELDRVALNLGSLIYEMCDLGDFLKSLKISAFSSADRDHSNFCP